MARFNEILAGRFNRALQKFLDMKGGPPSPQLASEISSNFQFNQMGIDFRYLEGWNRFGLHAAFGASVGNNSGLQLRNPVGSNLVVIIESLRFFTVGAPTDFLVVSFTRYGATIIDLTNIGAAIGLDSRMGFLGSTVTGSALSISTFQPVGSFAVTPATYAGIQNQDIETIVYDDQQLLIVPGDTYRFTTTAANNAIRIGMKWRERFLEDSERA